MLSFSSIVVLRVLLSSGGVVVGMHCDVCIFNTTPIEISKVILNIVSRDISVLDIVSNQTDLVFVFHILL